MCYKLTGKNIKQQFTLEQISNMLNTLKTNDYQRIIQILKAIIPQYEDFLKTRPISEEEANDLFEVYLQIRFWSKKIDPHNKEEEYRKDWIEIQMQVVGLLNNEWLEGMYNCLIQVREYLRVNEVIKEGIPIDTQEIVFYLKQGDYFVEEEEGRIIVHLDEEQYNELIVETLYNYLATISKKKNWFYSLETRRYQDTRMAFNPTTSSVDKYAANS